MKQNILPKDWQIKTLGEVCKLKNGYAFKSDNYLEKGIPVIRISDIKDGLIVPRNTVHVSENSIYDSFIINENEIIVAMSGATTGKFGIYKSKDKAYQNQRVGKFDIIDKTLLDNNFLLHQLHSLKRQIEKDAYGGAQPNISSTKIEEMEIVLPPLQTQQAIVSKIEELFSELDKGIEDLKTAQQQLKTYRQSVLKCSFEGKLTNDDVVDNDIQNNIEWIELGNLCTFHNGDRSKKYPNKNEYVNANEGVAFINTGHIKPNGKLSLDKMNYISKDKLNSLSGGKIKNGDLVYCLRGATIGKTAVVDQFNEGTVASSLVIIRANEEIYNRYIYYFLISPVCKNHIKTFDNGTAQPNLSAKSVTKYLIPNNIYNQQINIVQEIERRLSVADKMEESIAQSLQQAEALRQSILKKAFSGELI